MLLRTLDITYKIFFNQTCEVFGQIKIIYPIQALNIVKREVAETDCKWEYGY